MRIKTASILGLLIAASLIATGASGCGGGSPEPTSTPTPPPATPTPTPSAAPTQPDGSGELLSVVHGENPYVFIPDTLDLELGKTYTLDFNVPTEFHTFTLSELGIDIFINAGEKVTEDITINQVGVFELVCTPHFTLGMVGTVTVS